MVAAAAPGSAVSTGGPMSWSWSWSLVAVNAPDLLSRATRDNSNRAQIPKKMPTHNLYLYFGACCFLNCACLAGASMILACLPTIYTTARSVRVSLSWEVAPYCQQSSQQSSPLPWRLSRPAWAVCTCQARAPVSVSAVKAVRLLEPFPTSPVQTQTQSRERRESPIGFIRYRHSHCVALSNRT